MQHLDHHDAEILLRLYELRREEKLRQARSWFIGQYRPESREEFMKRFPPSSPENAYWRMVVSYWEMASSLLNHGLINEDLFFESNGELWAVWMKLEPSLGEIRERSKDPRAFANLETAGKKYEAWMEKRAPGALTARRAMLEALSKTLSQTAP
ncbi:MAG: DUF4760 domain-containing protein [Terriglobia bacterium]